eukprot:TRINITY_DN9143_c0_g2_i1.p1 TRINITY_DN9143_c0_g2~~TRINITY_DN9143_c0_g2_i1.p1  ORF type:complete len:435 (+),score=133.50 TRINITY_DN9143_c0_g2_i1:157-1461(+)
MDKRTYLYFLCALFVGCTFYISSFRSAAPPVLPQPPRMLAERTGPIWQKRSHKDPIPRLLQERAEKALRDYADLHRRIMDPTDTTVEKKFYINGKCIWGLGNFQIRTVAGFVISLLTNRAFVTQDPMYNEFYSWPLPHMNLTDAELEQRFGGNGKTRKVVDHQTWDMCVDFENNLRTTNGTSPTFAVSSERFFGGLPWFVYVSPVYTEQLRTTFGKYLYHFVAKFLFANVNNPDILALKHSEEERLYAPLGDASDQYRLGIQIRWGRGQSDFYLSDMDKDQMKFWTCADEMLREQEALGRRGVIFLATDHMGIRNRTVARFASRQPPVPVLHLSATAAPESAKHIALVDQWFLMDADDLIVTQRSTFGFYPQAVGLHTPKVVHRVWDKCEPLQDSQAGMVTRGGQWPFGTSACGEQRCCLDNLDLITGMFGQLM